MKKYLLNSLIIVMAGAKFCFGQNISPDQFRIGDIVDEKYAAFGLGTYREGQEHAYHVKFIGDVAGLKLICFYKDEGANPIMNPEEIELFLLKHGNIIDRRHERFGREKSPEFEILHDIFIQYIELKHKWFSNEADNQTYNPDEDHIDGLRFVVKEGKMVPLASLSKSELRIYRNLIFAKYGYIFKSEDLNAYFRATNWYKPNRDINVEQVVTEKDKELVNTMLKLESDSK
jgi:hypothetical protein